ncbi:MAG: DUF2283 domain-containing protein [Planctomycetes bacterium RBG_16_55_9]|nr:MAG: DUF2283 domain-containing protein [Planctomycetes bacterium RBG_16_55_9]
MAEVKVFFDRAGNTLTVWLGNPKDEDICEETGDEVVLMKDKSGRVIGFEKLNFLSLDADRAGSAPPQPVRVAFEAAEIW